MAHPRAGQPALPEDLIDVDAVLGAYYDLDARPEQPGPAGRVRHLRSPRLQPGHRVQRAPHRRHHPGHRGVPGRPGHHRSALHRQGHPRAVPARLEDRHRGARRQRGHRLLPRPTRTTRRPRRCPGPSSCTTPTGRRRAGRPTASWSPRPTTRRATAASSTTRRTADRPTPTPPPGSRPGPTSCWPTCPRSQPEAVRARSAAELNRFDYLGRLLRGPGQRARPARHPRRRRAHRRRPAGRRQRAVLGLHRRAPRHRPDRDQPEGRSAVGVHDPRHRRQDPDGLLLAERDGQPDQQQGRVRHLHRQRRRLRPARHRHPRLRPDEPERLPGRRHPVPVRPPHGWSPTPGSARPWSPPR